MKLSTRRMLAILGGALLVAALSVGSALASEETNPAASENTLAGANSTFSFNIKRSTAAENNGCLENAKGKVNITTRGGNQIMEVSLSGMPKKTGFTLFIIQQPDSPFGLAWYQGDLDTDKDGKGSVKVKGIFSEETHVFAVGTAAAPQVDGQDQTTNPPFPGPVHTAHVGVWFADPEEAEAAGCTDTSTPFDGDHNAGIQALSSKNFGPLDGPLLHVQ